MVILGTLHSFTMIIMHIRYYPGQLVAETIQRCRLAR